MRWRIAVGLIAASLGAALSVGAPAMAQPSADIGYLTLTCDPPANVFVDDVDLKTVTPLTHYALKAGRHKIGLVATSGKARRSLGIVINAGQEQKLSISL